MVAEEVETAAQLDFLRQAGCDVVQGYYLARPMAVPQLTELVRQRRNLARVA